MLPPTIKGKARRREGDAAGGRKGFWRFFFFFKKKKGEDGLRCVLSEGNTLFRPRWYDCRALSSFRPLASQDSSLRALPALYISARESAEKNRKEGVHVAAAPPPFLVNGAAGSASTKKNRTPLRYPRLC